MSETTTTISGGPDTRDPVPQPPSVVGFGIAEMSYLLREFGGEHRLRNLDTLRLDAAYATDEIAVAGASALVARGYAVAESTDRIQLAGPAELLAYVFGQARRWTELSFIDGDRADVAMYVQAPLSAVVLQPRGIGTWYAMFKLPEGSDGELLKLLVDTYARVEERNAVAFRTSTLSEENNLFVRKASETGWNLAWIAREGAQPVKEDTDGPGVVAALDRLTALPKETA